MKYGMNLLLWSGNMGEEIYPVFEKLKEMGYDGVELPIFDLDPGRYEAIGKKLDELELERSAVTVRNEDDNPISPDAEVRARGVKNNKIVLDCCEAVGAHTLYGPYHSAIGFFSGQGPTEDEKKWGIDSMRQVAEHAAKCRVMLGVECLNRFECYYLTNIADTVTFIDSVGHPNCRMMYDTFHANIEEKNVSDSIRSCAKQMVHVHISENDRSTPGAGHVDWQATFDALSAIGYSGWLMVEAFGLALPEIAAATKIWRRMYESEEQLARDALAFMKKEWTKRL